MEKVFLSFHFDEEARKIADQLQDLIDSHLLLPVTGERLGGEVLWEAVEKKIAGCDALICLMTEREPGQGNDFVRDERNTAIDKGLKVLTILQKGQPRPTGKYAGREYVTYDPDDKAQMFLDVSSTIGEWRRQSGRFLSVYIEPDEAVDLARDVDEVQVQYRTVDNRGDESEWTKASVLPELGGATVYLKGVPDNRKLQLEMTGDDQTWKSDYVPQTLPIRLRRTRGQ